jgi:serine/threonine protein kinase/formylglycine-generating enzyme required for sulfatase activity
VSREQGSPDSAGSQQAADGGAPQGRRVIGHYEIVRELGRGAQGVVYLAEDVRLRRKVALKMLAGPGMESEAVQERFRREAELTSKFDHPGICGLHEVGEFEGVPYISMQYVQGTTLAELLVCARVGAKPGGGDGLRALESVAIPSRTSSQGQLQDILRLIERVARALHVAHEAGLVHRDVKPGNIMVTPAGDPVLLDFGLARDLTAEVQGLTQSGQIIGTPAYLAPEQIVQTRGPVSRRTDVYALGVILFECLTLRRPFEAESWDALFHQILQEGVPAPRRFNPRLPRDLCTVIEVAMERDPARRYPTAEALADDLRRVRSYEPIQAKAAGRILRLRKWARRRPGRATAVAAAAAFVVVSTAAFTNQALETRRTVREHLRRGEEALAAGNLNIAADAASRAVERAPDSADALELKARIDVAISAESKRKDLALAGEARAAAVELDRRYTEMQARISTLASELLASHDSVFTAPATEAARAEYALKESELSKLRDDSERLRFACEQELERAGRHESAWGGVSAETERARADYYLGRWREALAIRDTARAATLRTAVETHDLDKRHERELLGRGTLLVAVDPPDAELFLFRYEDAGSLSGGATIPRLVPVPTSGIGRAGETQWIDGFRPGDECLVIRSVEPDSPAARANLRPGDLVVRVQGAPASGTVFAAALGDSDGESLSPARVLDVCGERVGSVFDVRVHMAREGRAEHLLAVEGRDRPVPCDPSSAGLSEAVDVATGRWPAPLTLLCLRDGEPLELVLEASQPSGLACERTAYPLIASSANRIAPASALTADPGSYLVLARAPGREDQRFPIVVERLADVSARIELLPEGSTPPGYVYVPPGPFRSGGDPGAFAPRQAETVDVPGFFVAREEVANAQWYEFVNDPETLARIDPAKPALLPRSERVFAKQGPSGEYTWDVYDYTSAESPVLGISWTDANEFLEWRNRKAEERDEPWRYELPSEIEWEKAARGVDGRIFPWGDRFDPSLVVCLVRHSVYLLDAPGGFEPRDESPYGVLDLAGSRSEWMRDRVDDPKAVMYRKRGGYWNTAVESTFHSASRAKGSADTVGAEHGCRLVARPR